MVSKLSNILILYYILQSSYIKTTTRTNKRFNNPLKDSAILSLRDFERIKQSASSLPTYTQSSTYTVVTSVPNVSLTSSNVVPATTTTTTAAQAFKQRLIDIDRAQPIRTNIADFDKDYISSQSNHSDKKSHGENDILKAMDKLVVYAKTATIRDRQLEERKFMEDMYKHKEQRLEHMMELERLKELKLQEVKEQELKAQQVAGSKIIIEQIRENDFERLKRKEHLEREKLQMKRMLELMAEEDKQKEIEMKRRHELSRREAEAANAYALIARQKQKIAEKEIDLEMMKFQREKDRQEEEYQLRKRKEREEKEKELQKLREKQERAQDKQAELDAVRSKRAYEASEKAAREKEEKEKLEKQRKIIELLEANEKQKQDRANIIAEEARIEKEEFNKICERQLLELQKEKEEERIKQQLRYENKKEVLQQIGDKADGKKNRRIEILEEGKRIKHEQNEFMLDMERERQRRIKELEDLKIKDKYIDDLRRFKIAY